MSKLFFLICLLFECLLMIGCEKQYKADDGYIHEFCEMDVVESRCSKFFALSSANTFSADTLSKIDRLLKDSRSEGEDNVAFVIIGNKPIDMTTQEKIRSNVMSLMYKAGFIGSRITDSGTCVYRSAKPGVRIDILKYDIHEPDVSPWSEYIGDMDTNKDLPKFGVSDVYNLREMIANKADVVSPRKYKGPATSSAVSAMGVSVGK